MEAVALKGLVASLLAWLAVATGYPVPPEQPEVYFKPRAEIERVACVGPCPTIVAFSPTDPPNVVYLSDELDVEGNVCDRSVLVHELVHHMQRHVGAYDAYDAEARGHIREMEALRFQNAYLAQHGRRIINFAGRAVGGLGGPYC